MAVSDKIKNLEKEIEDTVKADTSKVASDLYRALKDIAPSSWSAGHPAADLYAKAQIALSAFEAAL